MEIPTLPRTGTATLPATTWEIDPTHSSVGFSIRHLKFATVHGRFDGFSGQIRFDGERPWDAEVEAEIDVATIDTGIGKRDDHLRSADFFDVEAFPTITFRSTRIRPATPRGANRFLVAGDLMMHGVTRPLELSVKQTGRPRSSTVTFAASATLNRKDFGMGWNQAIESGGIVVGEEVRITIEIQADRTS